MTRRLIYQVYVGMPSNLYDVCVKSVADYCRKHNIDHKVQIEPQLMIRPDPFQTNRSKESYEKHGGFLPIYEKENAFGYFDEYDQIAIIDADVWIRPDAPNVFEELEDGYDFAGVVEREMPLYPQYQSKIRNYSEMQYSELKDVDWKWNDLGAEFMNMGVMVMNSSFKKYLKKQSPKEFLERYEFKRFIDGLGAWKWSTDQTLLNWWIKKEKMKVKHLDWKFNGLYTANIKITQCHFVHFFLKDKLPNKGENVKELIQHVS